MKSSELIKQIEAVLFYLAEPVKIDFLAKTLEVSKKEIEAGLKELEENLKNRGVRIVNHNDEIVLTTAPELAPLIEKIIKEERERDLGRAGIETLSIIAYKGPVSKKEIEYIRGVNSQFALRNLLLRGLVERKASTWDERVIVYSITADTLRYLGLSRIDELPEYGEVRKQLEIEEAEEVEETENENG
ncbi:MAG: segregation and condensation protein B [Parcubacteria bacterium C7867-006]|nr:MAG: segregation and condensation protein B [Parcubacteria bacterium C7867-006]